MMTEPIVATRNVPVVVSRRWDVPALLADYWAMTKPEVNFLIGMTTIAGFYLASPAELSQFQWLAMLHALLGTVLTASGAAVLNQWVEYPFDARMRRTARRPIAGGRVDPFHALAFGAALSLAGVTYLTLTCGDLASLLAFVTLASYLLLYTPLKRVTPLCTLVGAVPGAAPPLVGWAAARGQLDPGAWLLFAIVFLWQFPHFMSIAWMYRDDYERAGYVVLPDGATRDRFVSAQTLLPLVVLLVVSLLPVHGGQPRLAYGFGALLLGCVFLASGARFTRQRSGSSARRLLMASILYLPSLLALIILLAPGG